MTCENCKKNCINTKSKPWLYLTPVLTLKNSFFIHFSWEASNTVKGELKMKYISNAYLKMYYSM